MSGRDSPITPTICHHKLIRWFLAVSVAVFAVVALGWLLIPGDCCSEPADAQSPQFVPAGADPDLERSASQQARDEQCITIRQANLFHRRCIDTFMKTLPDEVTLEYCGILATDNGRIAQRIEESIGEPLVWHVLRDVGVFSFGLSTVSTKESVARCRLDNRELFVNVYFVHKARTVDERLLALGGRSVRNVLAEIEKARNTDSQ